VKNGKVAAARLLIELGADTAARGEDGMTPVELAGEETVQRLFQESPAEPS